MDQLACFRVLAAMYHPNDAPARQRMLYLLKAQTGSGVVRGAGCTDDEFIRQVKAGRGSIAGALLLNLIQLDHRAPRASLNKAIAMLQGVLPPWEQPQSSNWHCFDWSAHLPRRRETVIAVFNEFLGVSHLWAAVVHAGQHGRDDIWPGSPETLPRFLAYAEAFAELASRVRWGGRDRRVLLPRTVGWHFALPEALQEQVGLIALPLHPHQQRALHPLATAN